MSDWPHQKIRNIAMWYINKHAMEPSTWAYTRLTGHSKELTGRAKLNTGELPIVTCQTATDSWYVFTTYRVIAEHAGHRINTPATQVELGSLGDFKGHDGARTRQVSLVLSGCDSKTIEYETGRASIAPFYYFTFWGIKYPILDKLKFDPSEGRARPCNEGRRSDFTS